MGAFVLTEIQARRAVPREKDYKLADAGGLHLFVSTKGHRSWRWKYRFGGKERRLVLGTYPDMSLRRARELRDEARAALNSGKDPSLAAQRARLARQVGHDDTFERFAREWFDTQRPLWKPVHANDVITSMDADLFPVIGAHPIGDVDEVLLLSALRRVEKRGAIETAHRLRQRADRVFQFAAAQGMGNANPAANVRKALAPVPPKRRWPALVDLVEIRKLIRASDRAGAMPMTRTASRFLALTAQRPGMVRAMEWAHVEGVDWADPEADVSGALWRVPADRMKLELGLREDDAFEHEVPLARAAVDVLRAIRPLTGRGPLPFCMAGRRSEPISENAIGYLYNREGWKGRHVPHGWRSSFSTIMNGRAERLYPGADRLLIDRLIIDLMLAHQPSGMSSAEFRYNRQAYMERRRELAEAWAALILEGADPASTLVEGPRRRAS